VTSSGRNSDARFANPRAGSSRVTVRYRSLLSFCTLFALLLTTAFAARTRFPGDESREEKYWKEHNAREAQKAAVIEQQDANRRDHIQATLPNVVRQGEQVQSQIITAEVRALPPVKPSIFSGKGEYITFGVAAALLSVLTAVVLIRHRREAEIRALSGGYLSDGTEVAKFKMPELFAPSVFGAPLPDPREKEEEEDLLVKDPREAFFTAFPEYLAGMRDALQELGRTEEEPRKQKLLTEMAELIAAFKVEANMWQLRPIMQVSTVLELLLQRLAEKTKDITPSALRTIAGSLDLLADLAVPDLRADLLVMPPLEILAVDDEPLCLRAVAFALQKANLTPELARDGKEAVELARRKAYDVIFMDIQMPEMDGFEACTKIHEGTYNSNTPVVFVTSKSDFQTRAKSNLIGGKELMAKPFLIFELTVKAITYAARKRLQPPSSLVRSLPPSRNPTPTPVHPPAPKAEAAGTEARKEERRELTGIP